MVGLHDLKALYDESDESVVSKWVENPYWQYFCGEVQFQHQFPCHPTTLVKWRKRVGSGGMEQLLKHVIKTAMLCQALPPKDIAQVTVDTTVQEKAIAYPTDARLSDKARRTLVMSSPAAAGEVATKLCPSWASSDGASESIRLCPSDEKSPTANPQTQNDPRMRQP
jgi:hypothetical protein